MLIIRKYKNVILIQNMQIHILEKHLAINLKDKFYKKNNYNEKFFYIESNNF